MNREFVNIKVDREERPDVDRVYMTFVQATTGGGGWPMSVWLTPDLKPFVGGTYFPPEDRYGQPAFQEGSGANRGCVERRSRKNCRTGRQRLSMRSANRRPRKLRLRARSTIDVFQEALRTIRPELRSARRRIRHCAEISASGRAQFSDPLLCARSEERSGQARARRWSLFTLRKMAAGGMHDHVGGGFHRYSVDRYWHVPHFEKMLYDQAQLADRVSRCVSNHDRIDEYAGQSRAIFSITSRAT